MSHGPNRSVQALALGFLLATFAAATLAAPAPGEYFLHDGTSGMLTLQRDQRFDIRTLGVNDNTCGLKGRIVAGKATIDGSSCRISVTPAGPDILIAADDLSACRDYCGVQGVFEGRYRQPPDSCSRKVVQQARRSFKLRYDTGDFSAALAILRPVAGRCPDWIGPRDTAWIANDIALALFKAGDSQGCLDTLAFMQRDAAMSDAQFSETYPPEHVRAFRPVVRAARTNLRLCGG